MKYKVNILGEVYVLEEKVLEQMLNVDSIRLVRKVKRQGGTIKLGLRSLDPDVRKKLKNGN